MKIQLLRHASLVIETGGCKILVDPVFGGKGSQPPIEFSPQPQNNPLLELPLAKQELSELLQTIDAVIVTHTHRDHFDQVAMETLPKDKIVFCQTVDKTKLSTAGFLNVQDITTSYLWSGIEFIRIGGKHGRGLIGKAMGTVSGFIVKSPGEPVLYLAGDTIWCSAVQKALLQFQPGVTIVYAGAAQFNTGKPITMDREDVAHVCRTLPESKVVAVHMESYNHCLLSKAELQQYLEQKELAHQVLIPREGEIIEF